MADTYNTPWVPPQPPVPSSRKSTQQHLDEISTSDLVSLFVSPTTVYSEYNWGPEGRSALTLGEYHRPPFYKGTQHTVKQYPTVVDKLRFAQGVVPGLESLDQLISAKDRFGPTVGKPGYFVAVKDKDDASKSRKLSSEQIRLLHHSEEKPFGELSREDFATIQASLRKEGATVKRPGGYEDPTRAALTPPEILEDVPSSMQGHSIFFHKEKPSEELQEWTKQGVNFHRAPDGTMVISKRGADPEEWTIPHEKMHAALASDDPSINEFYRRELALEPKSTEEVFIEYALLKDAPVEEQQRYRDSIYLNYLMPLIGDPDIWDNEELLDKALRKFLSIKTNNPHKFPAPKSTEEELKRLEKMARYNDRFLKNTLSKFRKALYSSRYFLEHVKDSPLFPEEFREDIYKEYWAPEYVTYNGSDTDRAEGIARHFAAGGLVENNLKKDSYKGIASLLEASPDYELSPIGLGSMAKQAQKLAEYGRNGDVYIVHAAEGETVIPMEILDANPQLKKLLYGQIEDLGLDPKEFVVGNELNSINPVTGLPEFFFKKLFRGVKKAIKGVIKVAKKIAPIALPIAAQAFGIPFLSAMPGIGAYFGAGSIGAAALGGGLGSLIGGKTPITGALLSAAGSAALGGGLTSNVPFSQALSGFTDASGLGGKLGYLAENVAPRWHGPETSIAKNTVFNTPGTNSGSLDFLTAPAEDLYSSLTPDAISLAAKQQVAKGSTLGDFFKKWAGPAYGAAALAALLWGTKGGEQEQLENQALINIDKPIGPVPPGWPVWKASAPVIASSNPLVTAVAAEGGYTEDFPRRELLVEGPGTEKSDGIPAMLSDGEFVFNSAAVRGADPTGNNNRYSGAAALYDMMKQFQMNGQRTLA